MAHYGKPLSQAMFVAWAQRMDCAAHGK